MIVVLLCIAIVGVTVMTVWGLYLFHEIDRLEKGNAWLREAIREHEKARHHESADK